MFEFIDGPVREAVTAIYEAVGYLGVTLWVVLETVIAPIPSELVLPFAGFIVGEAEAIEPLTGAPWNPLLLVIAATVGSLFGGIATYAVGALIGRPALLASGRWFGVGAAEIAQVEGWFDRYGLWAALFGRMVPLLRSVVGYAAGLGRMPLLPYLAATVAGSLPFNALLIGAGVAIGANWESINGPLKTAEQGIVALVAVVVLLFVVRIVRARRRRGA
jgi:membrane protein DedA with SNARE-associated domain